MIDNPLLLTSMFRGGLDPVHPYDDEAKKKDSNMREPKK